MIKHIHSGWAYLVLIMLIIAFVNAVIGFIGKKSFKNKDLRISLFTLIVAHIQLVLGLTMYFISPYFSHMKEIGMGAAMNDPKTRLFMVEHPLMMILAIALITIGFSKQKKRANDYAKFKTITIFYGLALLLILSRIPWNQWLG